MSNFLSESFLPEVVRDSLKCGIVRWGARHIKRRSPSVSARLHVCEILESRILLTTPVVTSINRVTPAVDSDAASVAYTVTFNTPVTGVNPTDFNVFTGPNLVASPLAVVSGSGSVYTVSINGIHGNGDLRLDLIDHDSIVSQDTNTPLGGTGFYNGSFQGQSYNVLQTAPKVLSIDRATPAADTTSASSVVYTVTFSKDVTGVDPDDFQLELSGVLASTRVAVSGSGSVYTVTVSGIIGVGTLGLNLIDNGTIHDTAGNRLQAGGAASFATQNTFATSSRPFSVTTADVNGDSRSDLVTADYDSNSVSVLLGNGDGTFRTRTTFSTGKGPSSVVTADVNGDGRSDLITANHGSNSLSVLLGNGDGNFRGPITVATGSASTFLVASDLNGDGKPDLIAGSSILTDPANTVVLLGNGDGTFRAQATFDAGVAPECADVNGDGRPDLITANVNTDTVSVRLGNGDGTFGAQTTFDTGTAPVSVASADVNGDRRLDLMIANFDSTVSVLLGNGDGTFGAQTLFDTGRCPGTIVTADVNGDGRLDLITASERFFAGVSVLLGSGDGDFQPQTAFSTGTNTDTYFVVSADVNSDGRPDLIVANGDDQNAGVLLGNGKGDFTGQLYTIVPAPLQVSVASFNCEVGQSLSLAFNKDIGSSLTSNDLILRNLTSGTTVPSSSIHLIAHLSGTAVFTFTGILPDGNYRLTVPAGSVQDAGGNSLAEDYNFDFFVFAGDANRDRSVGFPDLVTVAQNYGLPGSATWSNGDFNYDGNVDFADLVTVAQKYGDTLTPSAADVAGLPAAAL